MILSMYFDRGFLYICPSDTLIHSDESSRKKHYHNLQFYTYDRM